MTGHLGEGTGRPVTEPLGEGTGRPMTEPLGEGTGRPGDDALRVAAARARAAELMPYLATALFACTPVRSDEVPTLAVDDRWRFYWNPSYCGGLSVQELAGGWLHEVGHLLREHVARFGALDEPDADAVRFNVAGDAVINADLAVTLPPGAVRLDHIPGAVRGMTAEQIYRLLPPTASTADCGSAVTPGRRPWDLDAGSGIDPDRADQIRHRVAADIRAHGTVPAGLERWAADLLDPRVDWRTELNAVVRRRSAEIAGVRDYTYARPSRRAVPGVILPAMRQPRPPVVYAVVDTSGSMDHDRLARCLSEIDGIVQRSGRLRSPVRVVSCDTGGGDPRPVRSVAEVVLTGGGATDLRPGIAAVARARPPADLVVVLTDGDTPWEASPPRKDVRYVAVLVAGDRPVPSWVRKIVV